MSPDRCCETCRFWARKGPQLSAATRDPCEKSWLGTCQRSAPTLMMYSGIPAGLWPQTPANRFCGEWQREIDAGGDDPDDGERKVIPIGRAA